MCRRRHVERLMAMKACTRRSKPVYLYALSLFVMFPKRYFIPVLLFVIGIALIFLDGLLFRNEYSTVSIMGYLLTSTGIMYLLLMLVFRVRSVDYLFLRRMGAFVTGLGLINVLLMLLNLRITYMILPSLVVITFGLIFAGIGLMILPPYPISDEELLQLAGRKVNLIAYTIRNAPLARKIGWLVCAILGGWAGQLIVQQFAALA